MEKTKHFFEEQIYLVSNHSVALNPLFTDLQMQQYFKEKMEFYLKPVADILAYCISGTEYQILVKLKDRSHFEEYFRSKNKGLLVSNEIPETTYLFSQVMANLQVSFVKHFNYINKRKGTLMAGRFERKVMESEEEVIYWKDFLNSGATRHEYSHGWKNIKRCSKKALTSKWLYDNDLNDRVELNLVYRQVNQIYLGAVEFTSIKFNLNSTNSYYKMRLNRLFHQNGRATM